MQPATMLQPLQEIGLQPETTFRGRLTNLRPGASYEFEVVAPSSGQVMDSGLFATERLVPPSAKAHVVDGVFTRSGSDGEWSDVEPVKGRYAYLYADFDGTRLHLLNDWHLCRQHVSPWEFNKFELRTWPADDRMRERLIRWLIRVFADGHVEVSANGLPAAEFVTGKYGHATSPLVPKEEHSLYELSIAVAEAYDPHSETPDTGWKWDMEWLDPPGAAFNWIQPKASVQRESVLVPDPKTSAGTPSSKPVVLVQEPVRVRGTLFPEGGMTVIGEWVPPPARNGNGCHTIVRCHRDDAEVQVAWSQVAWIGRSATPAAVVCRVREVEVPRPIARTLASPAMPVMQPAPLDADEETSAWTNVPRGNTTHHRPLTAFAGPLSSLHGARHERHRFAEEL